MNNLIRYNPAREFTLLRREMDRLFGDVLPARATDENESAVWSPRADLAESQDAFVLSLDVPGVREDNLQITFEDDTLKVSGRRDVRTEQSDGQVHRIERSYGQFFRSFRFGVPVDADRVDAAYTDGVLTLRVPKAEASKPRRIALRGAARAHTAEVHSGDGASAPVEATEATDDAPAR